MYCVPRPRIDRRWSLDVNLRGERLHALRWDWIRARRGDKAHKKLNFRTVSGPSSEKTKRNPGPTRRVNDLFLHFLTGGTFTKVFAPFIRIQEEMYE